MVGFGVNPALESGLVLHRLYGHPYIPGSAVKGMAHHVAEMELAARLDLGDRRDGEVPPPPGEAILRELLDEAEEIHHLFGSLTFEEARDPAYHTGGVPLPPRTLLSKWRDRVGEENGKRIQPLLTHTGGRLVFASLRPDGNVKAVKP